MPERIQLSRKKGWRMPPNTVKVDRSGRYGNRFRIGDTVHIGPSYSGRDVTVRDAAHACQLFRREGFNRRTAALAAELEGKNVACWCALDAPCHGDIWLEWANRREGDVMSKGWIGVDLDGTLAEYNGWQGIDHIGAPVPMMMDRVKRWLREDREVRIFTARVCENRMGDSVDGSAEEARKHIAAWLEQHGIGGLEITNLKDYAMDELWDDRCVQVRPNTGIAMSASPRGLDTP